MLPTNLTTEPDILDASGFVKLADYVPDLLQEMRYFTAFNFVGERIQGYDAPWALMTREGAKAVADAAAEFRAMGCVVKVFDAYRPQMATDHFLRWLRDPDDIRMKPYFYPELDKSVLIAEDYIGPRSGHSRGSCVDMTLVDMRTGRELDMGGGFDYFGDRSHVDFGGLTEEQRENRDLLHRVMRAQGFMPLESEWWHFHLSGEPYPHTCFNFSISAVP